MSEVIELYEDTDEDCATLRRASDGDLWITRGSGVWGLEDTGRREGQFAADAKAWADGTWEPAEEQGWVHLAADAFDDNPQDLRLIATWTPTEGVQIESRPVGEATRFYIGPGRWRIGHDYDIQIYEQVGPEPSDRDWLVGTMLTAEDARRVVEAVNAQVEER
jgi:hypothetical protein